MILDALKNPLPKEFADRYVISVSGLPILGGSRQNTDDNSSGGSSNAPSADTLDRIKALPGWKHPYELMPGYPLVR